GIRDLIVTGVQTCALPIYGAKEIQRPLRECGAGLAGTGEQDTRQKQIHGLRRDVKPVEAFAHPIRKKGLMSNFHFSNLPRPKKRSEERRVGKECRARGWTM